MFHLESQGSPRERGIAQGRCAPEQIAWLIAHYRQGFRGPGGGWLEGLDPDARRRAVDRLAGQVRRLYPEGCEEIEGIAEGAGLPFEAVFELNVVFELGRPSPACSVYGFADPEGRVWLGKSDDLAEVELGSNVVHQTAPSGGLRSVQMHFAGTIWTTSASNEGGFCLGMTGLSGRAVNAGGIPTLFLLHAMAERCRSVAEAVAMCADFRVRSGGMSVLMGDATGDVAILEKHAEGQVVRRPSGQGRAVWQTNHCCDPALAGRDDPAFTVLVNSRDRAALLARLDPTVERSREGLMRLYRTHDPPAGICQHGAGGMHTDSAILLSPDERAMWVTEGYPCRHPFVRHGLKDGSSVAEV
jgi:isopenicillin-N N-acyltransferase-like protein